MTHKDGHKGIGHDLVMTHKDVLLYLSVDFTKILLLLFSST